MAVYLCALVCIVRGRCASAAVVDTPSPSWKFPDLSPTPAADRQELSNEWPQFPVSVSTRAAWLTRLLRWLCHAAAGTSCVSQYMADLMALHVGRPDLVRELSQEVLTLADTG